MKKTTTFAPIAFSLALILAAGLLAAFPTDVEAAKKKKSNQQSCSHSCGPYTITTGGYTYYVPSIHASYRKSSCSWPSWGCTNLYNEVLARISPTTLYGKWGPSCGNTHSFSASITRRPPPVPPTANGAGRSFTRTATSTNMTDNMAECTPGVDCPETDLGDIIQEARLNPSTANTRTNTCPFFYIVGNEDPQRKISCSIISNGVTTILPKIQQDRANGMPLPVGTHTMVCERGGVATTTQTHAFSCRGNPAVTEV